MQPELLCRIESGDAILPGIDDDPLLAMLDPGAMNEGTAEQHRFRFLSVSDMFARYKPASWLIDGLIEDGAIALVFGESTAGKSLLVIDWACSIVTGSQWQSRTVSKGPVFFIAGEGFSGFCRRLRAWEIVHRTKLEDAPLHFSERPAALMDSESALDVIAAVRSMTAEHGKPALIIVDTVHRNFGGGDENSAADFGLFLNHIDAMRAELGAAVLLVHHVGHGSDARSRGSSSIKAAMDHEYRLSVEPDGRRQLSCTKQKDAKEPEPVFMSIREVELDLLDANGRPDTSAVLILDANQEPPAKVKKERGSKATEILLSAIQICGSNQREIVRAQFYALYQGDLQAKQKAFSRAWESYMKSMDSES